MIINKHTRATMRGCATCPGHYSTPLPCNHPQMILAWVVHRPESEVSKIIDSSDTIILIPHLEGLSAHYLLNQPTLEVLPYIGSKEDFLKFLTFGISSPLCNSQYFKVTDDQQGSLDSGDGSEDLVTLTALAHL